MRVRPDEMPKELKREIRRLAHQAHEVALAAELAQLEGVFAQWRAGKSDAFAVAHELHRFNDGPARQLWLSYNTNSIRVLGVLAAEALADGLLAGVEMSVEARAYLESLLPIKCD